METDDDTRLSRKVSVDVCKKGRKIRDVLDRYMNIVKPSYEKYC